MCETKGNFAEDVSSALRTLNSYSEELSSCLRVVDKPLRCEFCGKKIGGMGEEFFLLESNEKPIAFCVNDKCWVGYFGKRLENNKHVLLFEGAAIKKSHLSLKNNSLEDKIEESVLETKAEQLSKEHHDVQRVLDFRSEKDKTIREAVIQKLVDAGEFGCSQKALKKVGATPKILQTLCCSTVDENGYNLREDGRPLVTRYISVSKINPSHPESRFFITGQASTSIWILSQPRKSIYEHRAKEVVQ